MNREKLLSLLDNLESTIREIKQELDLDDTYLNITNFNLPLDDYDEVFYEDEE